MTRSVPALVSFNGGELSPRLYGRTDYQRYGIGCRRLENFLPLAEGPVTRRPGFRFINGTRGGVTARLMAFEFSTVQAYVIEVGPLYFRFYRNGGVVLGGGGTPYEISHPYQAGDLAELRWVQSADTVFLVHPRYPPARLLRLADANWAYQVTTFTGTPSEWVAGNYPSVVTFYEERLVFGGTPSQPQTIWTTKTGNFEDLTSGPVADDGLRFTILDSQMNAIRWMVGQRTLLVGTAGGEFSISATQAGAPLTPSDSQARRQTTVGSAAVAPAIVGQQVIYVQRAGRAVHEIGYRYEQDTNISDELSVLARHLLRSGVVEMAWQAEPWRTLWCVLADGGLVGFTYMRSQDVLAWHRHTVGGGGLVRSVAVIPAAGSFELWAMIERPGIGKTIERMDPEFFPASETDVASGFFVDSGLSYSGTPVTQVSGLGHLAGQTVQVTADGAAHPDAVVSGSGVVTLQRAASKVSAGLGYVSLLETLELPAAAPDGSPLTRLTRAHSVGVLLLDTIGGSMGKVEAGGGPIVWETMPARGASDPMDAAPPLFTGVRVVNAPGGWSREARLAVRQTQALPMTLAGLVPRINAND